MTTTDIFERLNSGSVKLEAQELRNAVSRGPFNSMIKKLATDEDFRVLLRIDIHNPEQNRRVRKMEDVELVLRFFALSNDNYRRLRGGFGVFLSDEMDRMNELNEATLLNMQEVFLQTMKTIREKFGEEAFAKYRFQDNEFRQMSKFNAAVYDALAVPVAATLPHGSNYVTQDMIKSFNQLFANDAFFDAVSGSVNDREKVVRRIEMAKEVFKV